MTASPQPSAHPLIDCIGLHRHYSMGDQTVRALDGVDLAIPEGEMIAIIGTSGSGKSTLMNILGCLDTPSEGEYWLDGNLVSQLADNKLAEVRNHKIGFVFQQFNLLPRSTALENVEVPLFYRGEDRPRVRAQRALERVGLAHRLDHYPNQLSGGQRQRVAIARALVGEPAIILADEPTGNLDSATSIEIMNLFRELHQQGATIIVVTHEPDIAAWCERQVRLMDGKVVHDSQRDGGAEPAIAAAIAARQAQSGEAPAVPAAALAAVPADATSTESDSIATIVAEQP